MFEEIEQSIEKLSDRESGWVTRRDAAEHLGQSALKSIDALGRFVEDDDRDVREMVVKALGWTGVDPGQVVQGAPATTRTYSLEELVTSLEKADERIVERIGDGYAVTVHFKGGRSQRILVEPSKSHGDRDAILLSTCCGEVSERALSWALRNNKSFSQCALAIGDADDKEMFYMVNTFLADEATPAALKASLKEVAFYGDWVESKLTGGDEF